MQEGDSLEPGEVPMDSSKFRQYGYTLIDYISNYLDTIDKRRVTPLNIEPGYLKSRLAQSAPQSGDSFANIMADFEKHIMCGITHWQHPHFHAYFPAGNAYPSILADMLSAALGCVGFSWAASPAYTELEVIMLDWMGKMIGLPEEFLCQPGSSSSTSKGGGVIQGSASECVLVNLLAARQQAIEKLRKKYPNVPDGVLLTKLVGYCSKEAHSCVEKAAMVGLIRMRALDTDEKHSLRGDTLLKMIGQDEANGLEPFLVCATLGTTSCVSFDNLYELGQVCRDRDIWLHVDAAYAGSALICPEFKYLMQGIEMASSFNMNPNKWMLINFDCSLMWVKDRFKLTRAFVVDPLYLQHSFSDQAIDYRHWGIALSRRFRALKLWFVIRNYGVEGLQSYIRNHVRLAKLFESLIRQDPRFSITNEVVLGLVCFRLVGSNALNQRLLSMINASGKLHMVPASLNGRYVIRFCVCQQNAKEADIEYAYRCISSQATELFDYIRTGKERIRAISQQNTIDVSSISLHTQQSTSADRLQQQQQQQMNEQQVASGSNANSRQALLSRRAGSTLAECGEFPSNDHAEELGDCSPDGQTAPRRSLTKQGSTTMPSSHNGEMLTDEELEQEVLLGSMEGLDGHDDDGDYDDDDDDEDDEDDYNVDEEDDDEGEVIDVDDRDIVDDYEEGAADALEHKRLPDYMNELGLKAHDEGHDETRSGSSHRRRTRSNELKDLSARLTATQERVPNAHNRQASSRTTTTTTTTATSTNAESEAQDEFLSLAGRRNCMSLKYKRKFFVRVVSDPRVYRASVSGDINAHDSCLSLASAGGGNQVNHQHTSCTLNESSDDSSRGTT